jgi:hypothetical protein
VMHGHEKVGLRHICGEANCSGAGGAKDGDRGKCEPATHVPDAASDKRATGAGAHTETPKPDRSTRHRLSDHEIKFQLIRRIADGEHQRVPARLAQRKSPAYVRSIAGSVASDTFQQSGCSMQKLFFRQRGKPIVHHLYTSAHDTHYPECEKGRFL